MVSKIEIDSRIIDNLKFFNYLYLSKNFLWILDGIKDYHISKDMELLGIYLPEENEVKDTFNIIKIKVRSSSGKVFYQFIKVGKFISALYSLAHRNIESEELFTLSMILLGEHMFRIFLKKNNLKVIESKDIEYFYSTSNYEGFQSGSLWGSCMNDKMEEVKFYNLISDEVSILAIVDSSGSVYGRSLLWETDKGLYLDRCYLLNDIFRYGYIMYVYKEFGIKYYYDYIIDTSKLDRLTINLKVIVRLSSFIEKAKKVYNDNPVFRFRIPYLDTFRYFELRSDKIYLYNSNDGGYDEIYNIYNEILKNNLDELLIVEVKNSDITLYMDHYFSDFPKFYSSNPKLFVSVEMLFNNYIFLGNLLPVKVYPHSYKNMYILDLESFNSEFEEMGISISKNINRLILDRLGLELPIYLVVCSHKFFSVGTDIEEVYKSSGNLSIYQVFSSFKDLVDVVKELYTHRALEYIIKNYRVQVFYIYKDGTYSLFISKNGISINDVCSIFKIVKSKVRVLSYKERTLDNLSNYFKGGNNYTVIEFSDPRVFTTFVGDID